MHFHLDLTSPVWPNRTGSCSWIHLTQPEQTEPDRTQHKVNGETKKIEFLWWFFFNERTQRKKRCRYKKRKRERENLRKDYHYYWRIPRTSRTKAPLVSRLVSGQSPGSCCTPFVITKEEEGRASRPPLLGAGGLELPKWWDLCSAVAAIFSHLLGRKCFLRLPPSPVWYVFVLEQKRTSHYVGW